MRGLKFFKIFFLNLNILILLVLGIEIFSYSLRKFTGKADKGFLIKITQKENNNYCLQYKTHPFYGHFHDHKKKCKIEGGKSEGSFVKYDSLEEYEDIVVTLGGSTTDGFYSKDSSWPFELSKLIKKNELKYIVYNGGTVSYGSEKELLKLLISVPRIRKSPKYIISLNGINDLPEKRFSNKENIPREFAKILPFWDNVHLKSFAKEKYIKQNINKFLFLPSTISLMRYLSPSNINNPINEYNINSDWFSSLKMNDQNELSEDKLWFYNVNIMNYISMQLGAKYFVILQPTMGLKDSQIPLNNESNDYKIYQNTPKEYFLEINNLYSKLIPLCAKLEFCLDFSNKVVPSGNVYRDPRHHNSNGNKILAKEIFKEIFKKEITN